MPKKVSLNQSTQVPVQVPVHSPSPVEEAPDMSDLLSEIADLKSQLSSKSALMPTQQAPVQASASVPAETKKLKPKLTQELKDLQGMPEPNKREYWKSKVKSVGGTTTVVIDGKRKNRNIPELKEEYKKYMNQSIELA